MKSFKKLGQIVLVMAMVLSFAATTVPAYAAENTAVKVTPTYTTVTEGFDWGPAITKVILNMETTLNKGAVSKYTFVTKSQRVYNGIDFSTFDWVTHKGEYKDYDLVEERTITNAYVSDASGNAADSGNYITIEMEVGPTLSAGSPFSYDPISGFNCYVNTYYLVSVKEGQTITNVDSATVNMSETTKDGNKGNATLGVDSVFDLTGVSTYKDATYGAIKLNYATYSPTSNNQKNPLVIWLHGAGEGGTDLTLPLIANEAANFASNEIQSIFDGAYVLVPQSDTMWMNDGTGAYTSDGTSMYTKALMNLIEKYVASHSGIDTSRIYIGGCSNGGYMTMNMLMNYPDYFAAAYPVCEAYQDSWITDEMLAKIIDMPIWFIQAASDTTVNPEKTTIPTYKRLIAAGADDVHFTYWDRVLDLSGLYKKEDGSAYEYNGHFSWVYLLNNQCEKDYDGSAVKVNKKAVTTMEWLAEQSKTVKPAETTIESLKSSEKETAVVSWSKVDGATGYKVYMSTTSSKNGFKLVKTIKDGNTLTFTMKGLTSGKKVYFKVVAYEKSGSSTYSSEDSKVKSVKIQ